MIRKLVLKISPSPLVAHIAQLAIDRQHGPWPAQWELLGAALLSTASIIQRETDSLIETLRSIDGADGIATVFADESEKDQGILSTLGLGTVVVTVDIPTLLSDATHGIDAARAVYALIVRLADDHHFHCVIRLGTTNVDEHEALSVLADQAAEKGFLLDPTAVGRHHSSVDPTEVFGDTAPMMADDGELDEHERSFLDEGGINWPVSAKTLERVWREVAFAAHPDRHPDNPSAQTRFVALKSAYESLRSRTR